MPPFDNGVVGNERIEVEVRQAGPVAVPLVGDAAGEFFEDAEFEVDSRIEGPRLSPQQPAIPVRILLPQRRDVRALGDVPARAVEVPALADRDDFAELPLRIMSRTWCWYGSLSHCDPICTTCLLGLDGVARQLGVLECVGHRLFAVAVLAGAHHFGQNPRVLMVAGGDHDRVQVLIGQHLFGVLVGLGLGAE